MAKKFYSPEEVSKKFESLPPEIKNLLYSFEMTSVIAKVGEKNGLHIDQMDMLNTEAGYVMMGLTDTSDFLSILMEDLHVDEAKAKALIGDLETNLFSKIRQGMQQPSAVASAAVTSATTTVKEPAVTSTLPNAGVPSSASTPTPAVDMHPADILLTQKTVVSVPQTAPKPQIPETMSTPKPLASKVEPPKPQEYKADPYREPTV